MSLTLKEQEQEQEDKIYSNFVNSLRSARTKEVYDSTLKQFMKFHNIESYSALLHMDDVQEKIKAYIIEMVNRELSTSYVNISIASLRNLFEMNENGSMMAIKF